MANRLISLESVACSAGAINDYQKDLQFKKLNAQKDVIEVKVLRGGEEQLVGNEEIVVGDILLLDTGDKVRAGRSTHQSIVAAMPP